MTQPDKWDEMADAILDDESVWCFDDLSPVELQKAIATALREIESERARWERMATMAWALADEYGNQAFRDRFDALRAAKETKE